MSSDSTGLRFKGRRMLQQQSTQEEGLSWIPECGGPIIVHEEHQQEYEKEEVDKIEVTVTSSQGEGYLAPPNTVATSSSSDTLTGNNLSQG